MDCSVTGPYRVSAPAQVIGSQRYGQNLGMLVYLFDVATLSNGMGISLLSIICMCWVAKFVTLVMRGFSEAISGV